MTFITCWRHLEAAVVTEAAEIKAESLRSQEQGGTEIIAANIHIRENLQNKCQVCGNKSHFSVYYQPEYRVPLVNHKSRR